MSSEKKLKVFMGIPSTGSRHDAQNYFLRRLERDLADKVEFVYQMPIYTAIRSLNGGFIVLLKPRIINLTDSYIQLTDTTGINSNEVLACNIYYDIVGE